MNHVVFGFLFCTSVLAQTGEITGVVSDPAGAAVPAAGIIATETASGVRRALATNSEGNYTIPSLTPGQYSVSVSHAGFRQATRAGIQLQVGQQFRLDFQLEVGAVNENVTVQAGGEVLDTETASAGQVVQGRQVLNLPLLGRDPYALGGLIPGVRIARGMNDLPVDQISTAAVSINGARANQNEFLLDGAPNTAAAQNQPIIYANVDSIQEFKVETNSYSAEYGRAAGGIFNVVTKAGTNQLHFSLYEYL